MGLPVMKCFLLLMVTLTLTATVHSQGFHFSQSWRPNGKRANYNEMMGKVRQWGPFGLVEKSGKCALTAEGASAIMKMIQDEVKQKQSFCENDVAIMTTLFNVATTDNKKD